MAPKRNTSNHQFKRDKDLLKSRLAKTLKELAAQKAEVEHLEFDGTGAADRLTIDAERPSTAVCSDGRVRFRRRTLLSTLITALFFLNTRSLPPGSAALIRSSLAPVARYLPFDVIAYWTDEDVPAVPVLCLCDFCSSLHPMQTTPVSRQRRLSA